MTWVVAVYRTSAADESIVAREETRGLAIAQAAIHFKLQAHEIALLCTGAEILVDGATVLIAPEVKS